MGRQSELDYSGKVRADPGLKPLFDPLRGRFLKKQTMCVN